MKRMISLAVFAGATILAATPAMAQDEGGHIYAGITGGTLGIGPEVGYRLNERLGVRASASFLGVSHEFDSDDITYDGSVDLESYGAMLDVYPFGGGFRISGGFRINNNRAKAKATPTDSVQIGDREYFPDEIGTLSTSTDIKDFAPALTIGYAGSNRSGFVFGVEAGALFQGRVGINKVNITGICAPGNTDRDEFEDEACEDIVDDLEAERRSIQDDVDDYKVYPILQLTIGYRF